MNQAKSAAPPVAGIDVPLDVWLGKQLTEISGTFRRLAADIWSPAFRPDLEPMIFVNADAEVPYGYAVNVVDHSSLGPCETVLVSEPDGNLLALQRFGPIGVEALSLLGESIRLDVELGEQDCLVVVYSELDQSTAHDDFARFIVHEQFHMFQIFKQHWRTPIGHDPAVPYCPDRLDRRLASQECRALDLAVSTHSFEDAVAHARHFLQLRTERHERRPDLAAQDLGYEQVEGTARYVENRYAALNGRCWTLEPAPHQSPLDRTLSRLYSTGSQQCQLLDLVAPGWRQEMVDGMSPSQLLESALVTWQRTVHPSSGLIAA